MAAKLTLTVSQLCEYIRRMFQLDPMLHSVELKGEISNLKFHQSGTLFFTLKDEHASIQCVMYASDAERLQVEPFEGMRAVVCGSAGVYVKGGQMQFYASQLRADGVGALYERLMALKQQLACEGIFAPERKRSIPLVPDTIGVVSSPTGAVIHDILNVSQRRDPQVRILLCPVRVQGVGAAQEVVHAIRLLESIDSVSVIIVARGGGSIEDLWTFNEEMVVRAVAACSKPVVSAVGHETDVTLCDLAADLRVPTPSAAAECAVPLRDELDAQLETLNRALRVGMLAQIAGRQNRLQMIRARLSACRPSNRLKQEKTRLGFACAALDRQIALRLNSERTRLSQRMRELEMLSPYRVLSRGYAIVTREGMPVVSSAMLHAGDRVRLRFADGETRAAVLDSQEA
ncbi:MAG: exodeoxyribonuclease VII large subunit [Clostridia bacterium]|nr:exodeoxyribonuclease VII large subunit [Clostridia bacterium]